MGAEGAAIATVAAQAISFLAALIYIKKKGFSFPVYKRDFIPDPQSALRIWKVGLPLALQDALVNISFLVITAIVNTLGLVPSAAVGVVEKIIIFAMLPPTSFASAVAAMTAQNLGAGKAERARRTLWFGIGYALVFGVLFCIYCQWNPGKYHRDICQGGRGGQCSGRLFTVLFHRLYSSCLYFLHELLFQRLWKIGNFFCSQYAGNFWCAYSCHCVSEPLCRGIPLCDGSGFSLGNLCFTGDLPIFPAVSP